MGERLILGVDGGGTQTRARLVRVSAGGAWTVLADGSSSAANPYPQGWSDSEAAVGQAIDAAFSTAELPRRPVAAACLALAGAGRETERRRWRRWAQTRDLADRVSVTHDADAVIHAAHPLGIGTAIIAGTGSMAFARDQQGRTGRAGGFGYLFGDVGSAYWIVRRTLEELALCWNRGDDAADLSARLITATGTADRDDFIRTLHQSWSERSRLAGLARHVVAAADEGDALSCRVLREAGESLAGFAAAAARGLQADPAMRVLAAAGSVLLRATAVREAFAARARELGFTQPAHLVAEPVAGACRLAANLDGPQAAAASPD